MGPAPPLTLVQAVKQLSEEAEKHRARIVSVACSDFHSVALLSSGHINTWGGSLHGKLGRLGAAHAGTTKRTGCT